MRRFFVLILVGGFLFGLLPLTSAEGEREGPWKGSSNLTKGQRYTALFPRAGVYPYHCHIHPYMHGTVRVVDEGSPQNVTVSIQNFAFTPKDVTIPKGSRITWTNLDSVPHTVTPDVKRARIAELLRSYLLDDPLLRIPSDRIERALEKGYEDRLFGKLTYSGGRGEGRFVSFSFDPSEGKLENYTIRGWEGAVFTEVEISPWDPGTPSPQARGSVFKAGGNDGFLAIHDNPTALLRLVNGPNMTEVEFYVGPTVRVENSTSPPGSLVVRDSRGNHGHLVALHNATLSVEGPIVKAMLETDGSLLFLVHPSEGALSRPLHRVLEHAKSGKLGGVVTLVDSEGSGVGEEWSLGVHVVPTSASKGRVTLAVSSEETGARLLLVTLPASLFDPKKPLKVRVGSDEVEAQNGTSNPEPVLDSVASSSTLKGAFVHKERQISFAILIPHFSTQSLSIEEAQIGSTAGPSPTGVPAPGLVLFVLGASLVSILRRRKDS